MKAKDNLLGIFYRYVILLVIFLISSFSNIFYILFLKLTIYPSSWLLSLFYHSSVFKSILFVNYYSIDIIPACIAVSAYLLLLILNLTTQMSTRTRVYSILFSFLLLLLFNIIRIVVFSALLITNSVYFEVLHEFFWYFLSIILVVLIWFLTAYVFKIKNIPIYSDFKSIKKQ